MESSQILKIINRLDCVFTPNPLSKPGTKQEYVKYFVGLDYELAEKTIDKIILDGTKFFPSIAEINFLYKEIEVLDRNNRRFEAENKICYVCLNDGFILHRVNGIEMMLYCTECDKGRDYKYDGRNNSKNPKSNYYSDPVTKYFDPEELKTRNAFKKREVIPMPYTIKELLRKVTRKVAV